MGSVLSTAVPFTDALRMGTEEGLEVPATTGETRDLICPKEGQGINLPIKVILRT